MLIYIPIRIAFLYPDFPLKLLFKEKCSIWFINTDENFAPLIRKSVSEILFSCALIRESNLFFARDLTFRDCLPSFDQE
jgi:hypothetical protein